jgi:hypothetical protein
MISVHYHDIEDSILCVPHKDVDWDATISFKAKCYDDFADVSVYVYVGQDEYEPQECSACKAPAANSDVLVAYYFELACHDPCEEPEALHDSTKPGPDTQTDSPSVAPQASLLDCYTGPVLRDYQGECSYDMMPMEIVMMGGDGDSVEFTIKNKWRPGLDHLFALYLPKDAPEYSCEEFTNCPDGGLLGGTYTASCTNGIAEVEIFVSDDEYTLGAAEVPAGCVADAPPSTNTCSYLFVLPCQECGSRRLDDLSVKEAVTADEMVSGANEPSDNDEDIPYCESEDFPCEGEDDNMLYVCHYSTRKGYQTFCIPESDSDILRFYPYDYCGPCEGGYGGSWNSSGGRVSI